MTVSVTEEDIAQGARRSCTTCPVAIAVARAYSEKIVWVNTCNITIGYEMGKVVATPLEVKRFVLEFDAGEPVFPFEFTLEDA